MKTKKLRNRKNVQVNLRNRGINLYYKSTVKTLIKKIKFLINELKKENSLEKLSPEIQKTYRLLTSKLDKATKKGCIKKNNCSRKKSLYSKLLKQHSIKN